jgi:hypothetical protein
MSKAVPTIYPNLSPRRQKLSPGRKILSPAPAKTVPGQKNLSPPRHLSADERAALLAVLDAAVPFSITVGQIRETIGQIRERDKVLREEIKDNEEKLRELMLSEARFKPGLMVRHFWKGAIGRIARVEVPGIFSDAKDDTDLSLHVHEQLPSGRFSRKEALWISLFVEILEPGKPLAAA